MRPIDALLAALIGIAILAVIVSKNANTTNALNSAFTALSGAVTTIMKPLNAAKS